MYCGSAVESQSLPIQVINSDNEGDPDFSIKGWSVTIPSNSGHKFWCRVRLWGLLPGLSVTIPSNSGHKFWWNFLQRRRPDAGGGSQSLPIQVINSDRRGIQDIWNSSLGRSQSLPIQVINSDLYAGWRFNMWLKVTIPSNSGHKFWFEWQKEEWSCLN